MLIDVAARHAGSPHLALLRIACAASVWVGRRGFGREWQRIVSVLIGIALLWFALTLVQRVDMTSTVYVDNGPDDGTAGISNIYPVGSDGTVLKGVRLYDQDGNPITLGFDCPVGTDGGTQTFQVDGVPSDATNAATYPLTCPTDQGPFPSGRAPALTGTPSPSSTPAALPTTPAPAASGTPKPSVPATPTPTG